MKRYTIRLFLIGLSIANFILAGCGGGSGSGTAVAGPSTQASVVPPAPTGITAVGGPNQVTINWQSAPGASSYNIYWLKTSITAFGAFSSARTWTRIANATSPAVHSGLDIGAMYSYVVTAVNGSGESAPSGQVSAWTDTLASAPTLVTATGGVGQVTLTWNAVPGVTSYNIYWSTQVAPATPPSMIIIPLYMGTTDVTIGPVNGFAFPEPILIANVPYTQSTVGGAQILSYVWTGNGDNVSGGSINPPPPPFPGLNLHFNPSLPTFVVAPNTNYYFVVAAVTSAGAVASSVVSPSAVISALTL